MSFIVGSFTSLRSIASQLPTRLNITYPDMIGVKSTFSFRTTGPFSRRKVDTAECRLGTVGNAE